MIYQQTPKRQEGYAGSNKQKHGTVKGKGNKNQQQISRGTIEDLSVNLTPIATKLC